MHTSSSFRPHTYTHTHTIWRLWTDGAKSKSGHCWCQHLCSQCTAVWCFVWQRRCCGEVVRSHHAGRYPGWVATLCLKTACIHFVLCVCAVLARGEHVNNGESVPRPAVPGGRCHCANHEDAKKFNTQSPHLRTLQSAEVPCQGTICQMC